MKCTCRPPGPCLDDLVARERAIWLEYLRHEGSTLAYSGVVVQREVRFGDLLAETLAAAREHAVQLIVVGAEPQWPLARALRPALAQRLLAQPVVPILAVPTERPSGAPSRSASSTPPPKYASPAAAQPSARVL